MLHLHEGSLGIKPSMPKLIIACSDASCMITCGANSLMNRPLRSRSLTTVGLFQTKRSLNHCNSSASDFIEASRNACTWLEAFSSCYMLRVSKRLHADMQVAALNHGTSSVGMKEHSARVTRHRNAHHAIKGQNEASLSIFLSGGTVTPAYNHLAGQYEGLACVHHSTNRCQKLQSPDNSRPHRSLRLLRSLNRL